MLHEDQPARPWGTVTPAFWAVPEEPVVGEDEGLYYEEPPVFAAARSNLPEPPSPAPDFAHRFAELTATLGQPQTNGALMTAAAKAGELDQEVTAALGPADPNVANVRELRGLIARLQGRPAEAARWHLHTTGLHIAAGGAGTARARASAKHALADWREILDPAERAAVGREFLPVLTAIAGLTAPPVREVQAYLGSHHV
ncbi:hypothetical protein ACWCXH_20540 [Kitasatospora sp. NPDC001660]